MATSAKDTQNAVLNHVAATSAAQAQQKSTLIDVHKYLDQQAEVGADAEIAQASLGRSSLVISAQNEALLAAREAKIAGIREEFGADPTEVGSATNRWLHEAESNANKAYESLDRVHAKQGISALNDPLGWVSAQFTLPSDIDEHNYYAEKHNLAQNRLESITQSSDANVIASLRAAKTTNTEIAIAKQEQVAAQSALALDKLKMDNLGNRERGSIELAALTAKQADLALQFHQSQNSDAHLALAQRQLEETIKERNARRLERQDAIDAKKETVADQEAMRTAYNASARRLNKAVIEDLSSWRVKFNNRQNQGDPEFWSMINAGQEIVAKGGFTDGIPVAESAGHAAMLYANGSNLKKDPVGQFLFDRLGTMKLNPTAAKDKEGFAAQVTQLAKQDAKVMHSRIDSNSPNIYTAPPASVLLGMDAVNKNPILAGLVTPQLKANPNMDLKDDVLVSQILGEALKTKDINAAADAIKTYYTQAVNYNNKSNQYTEKGLPAQTGYRAKIAGNDVELTDLTAVKAMIFRSTLPKMMFQPQTSVNQGN